jgi:hypothetical protein
MRPESEPNNVLITPRLAVATLLVFCSSLLHAQGREPRATSVLLVRASLNTAGPYGENWHLIWATDKVLRLQVTYALPPGGSLNGEFFLTDEHIRKLREALTLNGYFSLPTEIVPSTAVTPHLPDLRIMVELDGRVHAVSLYSPEDVKANPAALQFLAIWNVIVAPLPLKPKW